MKIKFSKCKTKEAPKEDMHKYVGMNHPAAKELKIKTPKLKSKEVAVEKELPKKEKKNTRKHEIVEAELMVKKKKKYKTAHKKALKLEKLPVKEIKKKLKKEE